MVIGAGGVPVGDGGLALCEGGIAVTGVGLPLVGEYLGCFSSQDFGSEEFSLLLAEGI